MSDEEIKRKLADMVSLVHNAADPGPALKYRAHWAKMASVMAKEVAAELRARAAKEGERRL